MNEEGGQFVEAALAYIGAPYRHQGRNRNGLDCVGLVVCALHDAGLLTDEEFARIPHNYPGDPRGWELVTALHSYTRRLGKISDVREGDILTVRYSAEPQHLAIVIRPTEWGPIVVHAIRAAGVCRQLMNNIWVNGHRAKIHAAYRLK
jgi:cell wall-associated NlpC family hydrolase